MCYLSAQMYVIHIFQQRTCHLDPLGYTDAMFELTLFNLQSIKLVINSYYVDVLVW